MNDRDAHALPRQRDIWIYAGQVNMGGYERLCQLIEARPLPQAKEVLLVLSTAGGDAHAGFRIARSLQHYYGKFDVLVPRYCKSAGTLLCVGATTLYLANKSELGPLDVQVKKNDELVGRNSGLDILQAVNYLQNQALNAFKTYVNDLTKNEGLSTKVASDIASRLTSGLFSPIFGQIDPMRLAEMQRATDIAFAYGARLNESSDILQVNGLARLVVDYPSHGFIIDRKEARQIFQRVETPQNEFRRLSDLLDGITRPHINSEIPIVQRFEPPATEEKHEDVPDAAAVNGSNAASISQGSTTSNGHATSQAGS